MKTVIGNPSLIERLGMAAALLLIGQHAAALGTDAGTTVSNQATVSYTVNSEAQTPIESDPLGNSTPGSGSPTEFLVDRRVSFTLEELDGAHIPVTPGGNDWITAWRLTNTGNAIMDFRLDAVNLTPPGTAHGQDDSNVDMTNLRIYVANGDGGAGVPDPGADIGYVDELGEDEVVIIHVYADAPATLTNGQYANIELTATSADDPDALPTPGTLDPDLVASSGADDPTAIDNVFADTDNDGFEYLPHGYQAVSAALTVQKTAAVISDPFTSGMAVPGAIIEYTITVTNAVGAADATGISVADPIDSDVTFVSGAYGGAGQDIQYDLGSGYTPCSADPAASDTDGCSLDGVNLVVGNANLPITLTGGQSLTVQFQVEIPNL